MKYYIIAGEASGDLHASNLMRALLKKDAQAEFRFWGGDLMQSVGGELVKHYRALAFMGFLEVFFNLRTILKNIAFCKQDLLAFRPQVLILVDYPGFNMRIASFAKKHGIPVHYYISPQLWAWKESRIHNIKRDVDKMYVILPFEKSFYEEKHGFPVHYVGHPLLDVVAARKTVDAAAFRKKHKLSDQPIIALLPGSRKQEISKMLSVMMQVVSRFPNHQFAIAGAPSQELEFYKPFIARHKVAFVPNQTYDLLSVSTAALVASGTATLETALFKVPEIVCYKTSWISYQIGKRLVNLSFISLVNLIMGREVVAELIQNDFEPNNLESALLKILDAHHRQKMLDEYDLLEQKLGGVGASKRVAELLLSV